jgi:hypothetical protein
MLGWEENLLEQIFADALPSLVHGNYFEGWSQLDPRRSTDVQKFIDTVFGRLAPHHIPPDSIVSGVFTVLVRKSESVNTTVMRHQISMALVRLRPSGADIDQG